MKKIIPVLVAVALILAIGGIYVGQRVAEKYSYSRERADLNEYFGVRDADDVPILLEHALIAQHAWLIDGACYLSAEDVDALLNSRFYVGREDGTLVYTTPTDIITAPVGGAAWTSTSGESGTEDHVIARYEGETLYISVDYVRKFANFSYTLYDDPHRMVLRTSWGAEQRATITKNTEVRLRGGVKSEVLCDVSKGQQVELLEEMENWSQVQTPDGFIGYVENKRLSAPMEYLLDPVTDVAEETFTSISRPYPINLAWHSVYSAAGNDTLDGLVAATNAGETNGLNTIAPTWFALSDGEGGITSFASAAYVEHAHALGLEVWGVVDNFNNEGADTASTLARAASRRNLTDRLIAEARAVGLDGINVDFEQVPAASGEDFIQWIRELSIPCRKEGIVLSVDNYVPMGALNEHYDIAEQGVVADYVVVMAYDEHYRGSTEAGSVASIGYVEDGMSRTTAAVPAEKVIGGMPFYTRVWSTKGGEVTSDALSMQAANEWVAQRGVALSWDEETCQNYGEITDGDGALRQIWMEDAESIRTKVTVMRTYGVAGVAAWQLGFETPDIWDVIAQALRN